jgi:REP element-mobilizing transposase RayT
MKRYRVYNNETTYYFSTSTITAWLPVFQDERYFKIIIDSLKYCQKNKGLFVLGYVIMPTHVHLVTSNQRDTNLSDIMRDFRHFTSSGIRNALEEDKRIQFLKVFKKAALKLPKQNYKIWKDDFHPIALQSEDWFTGKLDYVHANPVRKGFVELPEYWKYSSARNWLMDDDSIIKIDREEVYTES